MACILEGSLETEKPDPALIKSILTVDTEAYPVSGFETVIMASQLSQSKFLPNSASFFGLFTDIVLHPYTFFLKPSPVGPMPRCPVINLITYESEDAPPCLR